MTSEHVTEEQRAFAEHIRTFYASLPRGEQALLEQIFALASRSLNEPEGEVGGYGFTPGGAPGFSPFGGLLNEIGFPALDAASKDSAKMSLKPPPPPGH